MFTATRRTSIYGPTTPLPSFLNASTAWKIFAEDGLPSLSEQLRDRASTRHAGPKLYTTFVVIWTNVSSSITQLSRFSSEYLLQNEKPPIIHERISRSAWSLAEDFELLQAIPWTSTPSMVDLFVPATQDWLTVSAAHRVAMASSGTFVFIKPKNSPNLCCHFDLIYTRFFHAEYLDYLPIHTRLVGL